MRRAGESAKYIVAPSGAQVPLSAVARIEERAAPLSINHLGQFPAATISFNLPPGVAIEPGQTQFRAGLDASFDADLFGRLRASERAASRA